MEKRLAGKVAIVTGGGRGLGRMAAVSLAAAGASVLITGRTETCLRFTAEEIENSGGRCLYIVGDAADRDHADMAVHMARDCFGRIDILVNNAMDGGWRGPLEQMADEYLSTSLQLGLYGAIHFMQACFPYFRQQHFGRIINVGSNQAHQGVPNSGPYSITKGSLVTLTRIAGREWGQYGITVNLITPVALNSMPRDEETYQYVANTCPMRRWGTGKDYGAAIVWLSGDDADYITMNDLRVDGGITLTR